MLFTDAGIEPRAKEVGCKGRRELLGEEIEYGECRLRRRSASETRTGSDTEAVLMLVAGGGGIALESKGRNGAEWFKGVGSNLVTAFNNVGVNGGRPFTAGVCFGCNGFSSRGLPFSEVYITATFVEGEFIVPVSDQPIATKTSALVQARSVSAYLDCYSSETLV